MDRGRTSVGVLIVILAAGATLSACVAYQPAPIDLTASATALETRALPPVPSGELSYISALELALDRAPTVLQARAAYDTALAAARTARVRPAMTLTLTAEYSRQSDPGKPWLYGGVLDVPLDVGGVRGGRIDTAELAVLKARYDVIEAVWATRSALRRAVADQALAEAELALAEQQIALRERRAGMLERRVQAGEDARPTALTAQTELNLARQRRTAAAGVLSQARAVIAAQLGVTVETLDQTSVARPPEAVFDDVSTVRRDAAIGRGDVLRAVIDYDIAEQGLRTAVAGQYPQVTIGPGYTWERGITKIPFNLGLVLPPMDGGRAAINEAEKRRAEAGVALEAAQARVFAEVDAAAAGVDSADRQSARIRNEDMPTAARLRGATDRAVGLGELDRTDALAAQASEIDVALNLIDVQRQRAAALADFEAATRVLADPLERERLAAAIPMPDLTQR